ncbi:Uncharacterised protein [Mycobacterium tuberculosis]|nr:Uncharacterised protein [Mycobacterium tuberculosis]
MFANVALDTEDSRVSRSAIVLALRVTRLATLKPTVISNEVM